MIPEFSRSFAIETFGSAPRHVHLAAGEAERSAVMQRFGLAALHRFDAHIDVVESAGGYDARGRVIASIVQHCVVSGEPVAAEIDAPFALRFVDPDLLSAVEAEIELSSDDLDVLAHTDGRIDLGEAVTQTLGLALDPFPRRESSTDDPQIWRAGTDAGPFAALASLLPTVATEPD